MKEKPPCDRGEHYDCKQLGCWCTLSGGSASWLGCQVALPPLSATGGVGRRPGRGLQS